MSETTRQATIGEAFTLGLQRLREEKSALSSRVFLPVLVLMLTNYVTYAKLSFIATVIATILYFLTNIWITVVVHRTVLLTAESVSSRYLLDWTSRETKFSLYITGLGAICALVIVASLLLSTLLSKATGTSTTSVAFTVLGSIGAFWLYSRYALVLPALAIDFPLTFAESWELSKGHQLLMMSAILIVPLVFGVPISLIDVPGINELLAASMLIVEVSVLSAAFRLVVDSHVSE